MTILNWKLTTSVEYYILYNKKGTIYILVLEKKDIKKWLLYNENQDMLDRDSEVLSTKNKGGIKWEVEGEDDGWVGDLISYILKKLIETQFHE